MNRITGWALIWSIGPVMALAHCVTWAEDASLAAENRLLKARIVQLEAQLVQAKGAASAESYTAQPSLAAHAKQASDGWWEEIHEGIDRVDHFFYVPDTKAWALAEYWFDTRGFNTFTVEGASRLPAGFDVWGFTDFKNADAPGSSKSDLDQFFMEIDVKRELWHGLGPIVEYNDGQGRGDSVGRFGTFYQPHWEFLKKTDLWLMTKWFPLGTNAGARQGSVAWNWAPHQILDGRFSTGGFFDLNFDEKEGHYRPQKVSEVQLRYRLVGNLQGVLEYRYNSRKKSKNSSSSMKRCWVARSGSSS